MSAEKKKTKVRAGHRVYVKRIVAKVKELVENLDDEAKANKLKVHKKTLQDRIAILDALNQEILNSLGKEEDLENEIVDSGEFNSVVHEALMEIETALEMYMAVAGNTSSSDVLNPGLNVSIGSQETSSTSQKANCKLPKLILKDFSGEASKWSEFWDSFESAVHNNTTISAVDKFNYLRGLLNGPAASTIAGFSLSAANYEAAINLVKERFANRQTIIASHMEKLLKVSRVADANDTKQLRSVYDSIESNIRSLKTLRIDSEQYGSLLVPVMLNKLPSEFQLMISRKFDKNMWDFDAFLEAFRVELEAKERCLSIGI